MGGGASQTAQWEHEDASAMLIQYIYEQNEDDID